MAKLTPGDLISGEEAIAIMSSTLHDIDDGEDLAVLFNNICQPQIIYVGDNLFSVVNAGEG